MVAAIKHPVPDQVKLSFVILTSGHSDNQGWASECPDVKNYKCWLNPVWHDSMLYSCTHISTVCNYPPSVLWHCWLGYQTSASKVM